MGKRQDARPNACTYLLTFLGCRPGAFAPTIARRSAARAALQTATLIVVAIAVAVAT